MKPTIIIDMGHRKDTPGKRANGLLEWEFNKDVSYRIKERLKGLYNVFFTIQAPIHPFSENTSSGRTSNLDYRVRIANDIYKDYPNAIFVSIHANAHDDPKISGYEIFVYKKGYTAEKVAKSIMSAAKDVLGVGSEIKNRGIKEASFYVLKNTNMPAILIENEFYTNKEVAQKLKSEAFREKCAIHVVEGIKRYLR